MPRPKRDMIRINTYLPQRHLEVIKKIAEREDSTTADILRVAVREYLTNKARQIRVQKQLEEDAELRERALLARENNSAII